VSKIIHNGSYSTVNENFALYFAVQSAEHTHQSNCKPSVAQTPSKLGTL